MFSPENQEPKHLLIMNYVAHILTSTKSKPSPPSKEYTARFSRPLLNITWVWRRPAVPGCGASPTEGARRRRTAPVSVSSGAKSMQGNAERQQPLFQTYQLQKSSQSENILKVEVRSGKHQKVLHLCLVISADNKHADFSVSLINVYRRAWSEMEKRSEPGRSICLSLERSMRKHHQETLW